MESWSTIIFSTSLREHQRKRSKEERKTNEAQHNDVSKWQGFIWERPNEKVRGELSKLQNPMPIVLGTPVSPTL